MIRWLLALWVVLTRVPPSPWVLWRIARPRRASCAFGARCAVKLLALVVACALGCAPLPPLVYPSQVEAVFAPSLRPAATQCAARLNGHVRGASAAGTARSVLVATGASFAGAGAATADLERELALGLALAGALVALATDVVVRLAADPVDLLARHRRGLASWDAARRAAGDRAAELLERCTRDEGPPEAALPAPVTGERAP